MSKIYVIDTETTSLDPANGHIVEVGCALYDTYIDRVQGLWNYIVKWPLNWLSEDEKKAWIFENSDLTLKDITTSTLQNCEPTPIANWMRDYFRDKHVTSYNTAFDFGFLEQWPWHLEKQPRACIMEASKAYLKADRWLPLIEAYGKLCPHNPMGVGPQKHRAVSDAVMAAHVLKELYNNGAYDPFNSGFMVVKD